MKQDDLRGKIMNEVKSQIRGIVNEEVAKITTKQRLKDKIKPLVAEELNVWLMKIETMQNFNN